MQKPFVENEVLDGLKACAVDKALGPDGYTMGFFVHCWEVLKNDVMSMHNFHSQEVFWEEFQCNLHSFYSRNEWG